MYIVALHENRFFVSDVYHVNKELKKNKKKQKKTNLSRAHDIEASFTPFPHSNPNLTSGLN